MNIRKFVTGAVVAAALAATAACGGDESNVPPVPTAAATSATAETTGTATGADSEMTNPNKVPSVSALNDMLQSALDPIATSRIEDLIQELRELYTIVIVTHNMQQASRVSDYTAFFMADEQRTGHLVEYGPTAEFFTNPRDKRTEDYITGRFG